MSMHFFLAVWWTRTNPNFSAPFFHVPHHLALLTPTCICYQYATSESGTGNTKCTRLQGRRTPGPCISQEVLDTCHMDEQE